MNPLLKVFSEILYLGAASSILIVFILLIKKAFNRVLSPKWHYYIWVLLILRLILPFTPESSLSALNLFYITAEHFGINADNTALSAADTAADIDTINTPFQDQTVMNENTDYPDKYTGNTINGIPDTALVTNNSDEPEHISVMAAGSYLWLTGMLLLILYTGYINILFALDVKKNYKLLRNTRINGILNECKYILRIRRNILLYTTAKNRTPSLYAAFHTKILVSESHLENLSDQEIKCILLHELSHYRRKDITVNWVLTLLQIVYFFNPLIWFAFKKVHEDCEISCDALALKYLKEEEYQCYGSTVIKLIKLFSESNFIPATAGLWKRKSNYKRRILMISKYKKSRWPSTLLTIILIMMVGVIGLTGCKKTTRETINTEEVSSSEDNTEAYDDTTTTDGPKDSLEPDSTETNENSETTGNNEASNDNSFTHLENLLGLSKDELISKLGDEYNKVDEGGLEFTKTGIRVWFDDKSITNQVYTNSPEINFDGTKIGDSIDSFINVFGEAVSNNNGNALFKYEDNYLSVYYDTNTTITFAVYFLTEEVAAPAEEVPTAAPAESADNTAAPAKSESFYGDWVIEKVTAYGSAGTYSKEDAEKLIGKSMSFTIDSATCFGDDSSYINNSAKNPQYEATEISKDDFTVNYRMTFDNLGITTDSVTEVTVSDAEGNGCIFFVKDDNTLIVMGGGTYFQLVRKTK